MNDTLKQLYERKSVRAFTEREITAEDIPLSCRLLYVSAGLTLILVLALQLLL